MLLYVYMHYSVSQLNHAQNEVFLVDGVETANLVKSCYAKMINQQFY